MAVKCSGETVWRAGMIDVVRAVAATAAVQTPPVIDATDAQDAPLRATFSFRV